MPLPLPAMPWLPQFFKTGLTATSSVPNSGGFVFTYIVGSTTPKTCYQNASAPLTAHSNPIELDDQGRPPSFQIFLDGAYTVEEQDSDGNVLRTYEYVADPAYIFMSTLGTIQATGTTATSSPYTVQDTDNLVIVDSVDANFVVQFPPAADRTFPLIVKNVSAVAVRCTPDGAETLEGLAAYYVLPAASSPLMPTATWISDGVSAWWITGGIGL